MSIPSQPSTEAMSKRLEIPSDRWTFVALMIALVASASLVQWTIWEAGRHTPYESHYKCLTTNDGLDGICQDTLHLPGAAVIVSPWIQIVGVLGILIAAASIILFARNRFRPFTTAFVGIAVWSLGLWLAIP